ncbi:hypothetical protein PGRAN_09186 [Listeria grandensis FSL F6-0971]|uniref:Uncharacterized protein n=1 Tax=Listeria grandensis FSL F6-0971 TaxID=1265819 RepID=W7B7W7_9LIST|nr:hypothetical protein [Listeria grandensis]EUJ23334.1 hypothetical protein PGRAN_09186 [Listeria grandensis FSL F6-0971]
MSKVWTEFNSKSISHLNLNCMAIMGIELEVAPYNYKEYCIKTLDATLPLPENMNYFVLVFEEVEFPRRIDHYKKIFGLYRFWRYDGTRRFGYTRYIFEGKKVS